MTLAPPTGPTAPPGGSKSPVQHPYSGSPAPTGPATWAGLTEAQWQQIQIQQNPAMASAHAIIESFLDQFGLGSLATWAWERYLKLGGGPDAINQIQLEVVKTPEFNARFPAYATLAKRGQALSPAQMISLEQSYAAALHGAGIPSSFYDSPQDYAKFMIDNVSPSEVAQRAQIAAQEVLTAPPDARAQLQRLYGLSTGALIANALDPAKALPIITQQWQAAQNAAIAQGTGFGQLTRGQAEDLANEGVSPAQALSSFSKLASEQQLMAGTTEEGTNISQSTQLAAEFQGNAQAQQRIAQRQAQRIAAYQGGAGFNAGQTGITGLGVQP